MNVMHRIGFIALIVISFFLDQLSKWAVMEHWLRPVMEAGEPNGFFRWMASAPEKLGPHSIDVLPFYNTVVVWNYGISFGMFNGGGDLMPLLLTGAAALVAIAFFIWMMKTESLLTAFSLAIVVGGALGNIFDRVRFGAVFDFMDFHIFGYHWPAFNVADSCVVVGIFILLMHSLFFEKTVQT